MRLKKQKPLARGAGILLPVSSLPSPYGIGTFGRAAFEFVDFLKKAGQTYWQVLPLGPTSYGDSPYQSFSAFAGNPYFIDPDILIEEGLLTDAEAETPDWGGVPSQVDYGKQFEARFALLKQAYVRSRHASTEAYRLFCEENEAWLPDYSAYMAIKAQFGNRSWVEWPDDIRLRRPEAVAACVEDLQQEIGFWSFCQFKFYEQWNRLKAYANKNGVQIIGDIPIYVSMDSADVWVNSRFFQLDADRRPVAVSGVPPDMFSATGQLWGNPLYDWDVMGRDRFAWWKQRMCASAKLYDVIRIDHFIGIVRYYSIPAKDGTAMNGVWKAGPGKALLAAFGPVLGAARVIAEDLGAVTPAVRRVKQAAGYPGMKLMEFGFDDGTENPNLPHNFENNCIVYGGTHDNETLVGFFKHQKRKELAFAKTYLNVRRRGELPWALVRAAYASVADTVIFQMQDFLELDNGARMNCPSTIGGNWMWRVLPGQLSDELADRIRHLAETYARFKPPEPQKHPGSSVPNKCEEQ
ncbi:4-alpha-glucanotransferase [Ethanoligenens harbinense]|uniref:4-alpha-glucanotransferase n=1 Tax=Ethanoligenens harbinense (strain DSM 18485 / JCM 12961 / CGMCC 1.5033 / YUAN-3) TaxID=663278 RepID=E6U713_ETHHY|nr:4-alpha-glucanotransferase [Ethanoligenens harbinense]ADU28083.1 4-alpha-glucanotransferase [Ethanoligenens harbinense YUAN-3]AVQ97095.1 4-alpha-glucanotransferase [Ethanoligenens harbinense YUAN-3]AYF39757.1 4-alpha-glucanotransferase [Ethanoligenens harbinense]AYF42590.1 4-alpha-glucanotransferase [Ethanoligenens harbinense]QCN93338.1 4-alpha-glucanotransferase [Ethanoligenens harbinense]